MTIKHVHGPMFVLYYTKPGLAGIQILTNDAGTNKGKTRYFVSREEAEAVGRSRRFGKCLPVQVSPDVFVGE
jgi:hypothetical protein